MRARKRLANYRADHSMDYDASRPKAWPLFYRHVRFGERDLIAQFGDRYRLRQPVGMLLPRPARGRRQGPASE